MYTYDIISIYRGGALRPEVTYINLWPVDSA